MNKFKLQDVDTVGLAKSLVQFSATQEFKASSVSAKPARGTVTGQDGADAERVCGLLPQTLRHSSS